MSVLPKATYTAGNHRGRSDYELTALSRGKHFAKKPNLNFCLTTRASRADRDRSNKSSLVFSRGTAAMYIHIYTYPLERMAILRLAAVASKGETIRTSRRVKKTYERNSWIKGVPDYGAASGQFLARAIILSRR